MQKFGVNVSVLMPPLVQTDMTKDIVKHSLALTCTMQKLTSSLTNGIVEDKHIILANLESHLILWAYRIWPSLIDFIIKLVSPI